MMGRGCRVLFGLLGVTVVCAAYGGETPAPPAPRTGPEFKAVKEACGKGLEAIQATRTGALVRLLEVNLENADQMLKEKTQSRNVTGMAVARNARTIFENALTNLNTSGTFEFPPKVRRELDALVQEAKTARKKIEDEAQAARSNLTSQCFDKYSALIIRSQPELGAESAREGLKLEVKTWLEEKAAEDEPPPSSTNAPAGVANAASGAGPAQPVILGASGEAKKWVTVGRWKGSVASLDVVAIALAEMKIGTNRSEKANLIAGVDSKFEYVAHHAFPTGTAVPIRLKSVPGQPGGEVVEWPSAGNEFNLSIRLSAPNYPSTHGFDLQVGVTGEGLIPGAVTESSSGREEPPPPVSVGIVTQPPGASVLLDGAPVKEAKSPCKISVPAGTHHVELVMQGYESMVLSNEVFTTNRVVKWTFRPDSRLVTKTCTLEADGNQWYPSGLLVQNDAVISIKAEGEWSCGARGERCQAGGYKASVQTYSHYADPALRQVAGFNYGALLGRIGRDGTPFLVGPSTRLKASGKGMLYLDVNEVTGKVARADNTGRLVVRIGMIPPAATPSP
jgi:hypothetical protein